MTSALPWPEVLGHESVRLRLRDTISASRLPHALLFAGPEGVGKKTLALAVARELVTGRDPEEEARFDLGVHDRFVMYEDLEKPVPVRRRTCLASEVDEADLLAAYELLEGSGWIRGRAVASGPDVIDLLERNPEKYVGRKGIPFAEVLEKEISALQRSRKTTPLAVEVARRLFATGTSRALYRRNLGIELINGRGDGEYFRTVNALLRTSAGSAWRVAILDDAHKMTDAAENAFLKTLEEPPPNTLLVLVTSEPLSLLPTTISRCSRVVFDTVPPDTLGRFLVDTQGIAEDDAPLLVSLAEGSPGRALRLRDVDLAGRRSFVEQILPQIADGLLAEALALTGRRLAEAAASGERAREAQREEARLLLELLAVCFRDLVVARASSSLPLLSGIDRDLADRLAHRPVAWERLFERTEDAIDDVDRNVEARLAVEALLAEVVPGAGARA